MRPILVSRVIHVSLSGFAVSLLRSIKGLLKPSALLEPVLVLMLQLFSPLFARSFGHVQHLRDRWVKSAMYVAPFM